MFGYLVLVSALVAFCSSEICAARRPEGAAPGEAITKGYLEIEKWIISEFGDVLPSELSKYRSASYGAPDELIRVPYDWEEFRKLDPNDCSFRMTTLFKHVMYRSDSEWFRVHVTDIQPPHKIQVMLLVAATMHVINCHSTYEAQVRAALQSTGEKFEEFAMALSEKALAQCYHGQKLYVEAGDFQPWLESNAKFYQKCARKNPKIFVKLVHEFDLLSLPAEEAAKVNRTELVKRRAKECMHFKNTMNLDGVIEAAQFASETLPNLINSEKYERAWIAYGVCEQIGDHYDVKVLVDLLASIEAGQNGFSRLINCAKNAFKCN